MSLVIINLALSSKPKLKPSSMPPCSDPTSKLSAEVGRVPDVTMAESKGIEIMLLFAELLRSKSSEMIASGAGIVVLGMLTT